MRHYLFAVLVMIAIVLSGCSQNVEEVIADDASNEQNTGNSYVNHIPLRAGKYYDENRTFLGNCTTESINYVTYTLYYDLEGTLLGSCHVYGGPGGSGYKGGCNLSVGEIIPEPSPYSGMIRSRYDCEVPYVEYPTGHP